MLRFGHVGVVVCILAAAGAQADIIVNYTVDAGGLNPNPLNGLAARATFSTSDDLLSILLENSSTGMPDSFETSDSLLTSLGLDLPDGVDFIAGGTALIGPESLGLGRWSERVAGDSVGEEWLWTNDYGGDLLAIRRNVISTSNGQGAGDVTRFDGGNGTVSGPFGGIAADPPLLSIPGSKPGVSDSILFNLRLSSPLTADALAAVAESGMVEFGSDQRYLVTPEPTAGLLALVLLAGCRRRG